MNNITEFWSERSRKFGSRMEGVLLKSVPENINLYLNNWMFEQVKGMVKKDSNFRVLDIGCGYGRLSEPLIKSFPGMQIFGVDIAQNYVDLYNKNLSPSGKAFKADSRKLPFKDNFFDAVCVVTSLMYLATKEDHQKAVKEMLRVLKPGGKILVLERSFLGYKIFTLGGIIDKLRGKKNLEIPAVSFSPKYLSAIIRKYGGSVGSLSGIPLFTVMFPVILVLSLINVKIGNIFLNLIKLADKQISKFYFPSLYVSYTGEKNG